MRKKIQQACKEQTGKLDERSAQDQAKDQSEGIEEGALRGPVAESDALFSFDPRKKRDLSRNDQPCISSSLAE
jgi:hypothetical protein